MTPVQIDVFYPVPEGWGMCTTCEMFLAQADLAESPEQRGLDEYPLEYQQEFRQLSSIIFSLADRYQDAVLIRIWDPRSLQGMWKSIRHGIRRYPTFLVNGQIKVTGLNLTGLEQSIESAGGIDHSEI